MRRHTALDGWPRCDSRHYRFAMSNTVWEYKLKPIEFLIFSYLCYHPSTSTLTLDVISAGVHMTAGTVKKHLAALVTKGIVSEDGTPVLKCKDKNFFTLPNEVWVTSSRYTRALTSVPVMTSRTGLLSWAQAVR